MGMRRALAACSRSLVKRCVICGEPARRYPTMTREPAGSARMYCASPLISLLTGDCKSSCMSTANASGARSAPRAERISWASPSSCTTSSSNCNSSRGALPPRRFSVTGIVTERTLPRASVLRARAPASVPLFLSPSFCRGARACAAASKQMAQMQAARPFMLRVSFLIIAPAVPVRLCAEAISLYSVRR